MRIERLQQPIANEPSSPSEFPAWLVASDAVSVLATQAASHGRDRTFGWVRLADDARVDELDIALSAHGGEALSLAGPLVRARFPSDPTVLRLVESLPEVASLGAMPTSAKVSDILVREALTMTSGQQLPVFITLMDGDPDGRWRRELQNLGAVVGRFDSGIRVYTATVDAMTLDAIANSDFVSAIELVGLVEAAHDTAVPAMGADALRVYTGSPGLFSGIGGASVPIGVMDTGLNINHLDISSNRRSICGANFMWVEPRLSEQDLWVDENGHGTHVTGTMAGNGFVKPEYAGMAPSVSHIRFAKVLHHSGNGLTDSIQQGMDYLSRATGCDGDRSSRSLAKPLIVNMSLAASSNIFEGRGVGERKLDSVVWSHRQLYVVAQSNAGTYAFSNYGTAKSSLSVGAVQESGELASFSSHGPTADGRLAPQVVGSGVSVNSARGGGSRGGYNSYSGTSMASPAVAGVAALLLDAEPVHREHPALARARLMASAIRPSVWLDNPERFPANNSNGPGDLQNQFGLGKVSARTSVLNRDRPDGWTNGSAIARIEEGEIAEHEIVVPEGASQLAMVMTWDEPPTDTIVNAVLNDLDLYLDLYGDCGAEVCGEYSSVSRKDNVEWIIVKNPPQGRHRVKLVPNRIYTEAPRAALAWTVIQGDSAPNLRVTADTESLEGSAEITITVEADSYVAAGTRLGMKCRTAEGMCFPMSEVKVGREDGLWLDLDRTSENSNTPNIVLGEIAVGESQELKFHISYSGEDLARLYFTATAWNARPASTSLLLLKSGAVEAELAPAKRPINAEFTSAIRLNKSPQKFDLLLAATEPGEPVHGGGIVLKDERPSNSVWFVWSAPADGFFQFEVVSDLHGSHFGHLNIFQGNTITELEHVVSGVFSTAEFFAKEGETYKIRISNSGNAGAGNMPPGILYWSQNSPVNDDLENGVELEGERNSIQGSNQGATLEAGELFGEMAATVWYRWVAPGDGDWRFQSDSNLRLLVFTGDEHSNLRLVSGFPDFMATFTAAEGQEYKIAVATTSAYRSGRSFELSWWPDKRIENNDDFHNAEDIGSAEMSNLGIAIDRTSTVEPHEPNETGVRTKWYQWTAPEDGFYTWRLFDPDRFFPPPLNLVLAAFAGDSVSDLQLVGTTDQHSSLSEFVFQATKNQRFYISLGLRNDSYAAFNSSSENSILRWGPTPRNDSSNRAITLSGNRGVISGSNEFATLELNEHSGYQGAASIWYRFGATTSGWFQFFVDNENEFEPDDFVLTVYRQRADGLERILGAEESSRAIFEAEAGAQYLIRLGTPGNSLGGDFTLRWEEGAPPVRLKFLEVLEDGDRDAEGNTIRLDLPIYDTEMEFNSEGTVLFYPMLDGLQVFRRELSSGELERVQFIESGRSRSTGILWDDRRNRLYLNSCGWWSYYDAIDSSSNVLSGATSMHVTNQRSGRICSNKRENSLVIDASGSYIYWGYQRNWMEIYAISPVGLELVHYFELDGLRQVLISNSNDYVLVLTDSGIHVYQRDLGAGLLTLVNNISLSNLELMTISDDDKYLFTVAIQENLKMNVYSLGEEMEAELVGQLERRPPLRSGFWNLCKYATRRNVIPAADIFCNGFGFSLEWLPESEELIYKEQYRTDDFDLFGNLVPDSGQLQGGVASPDGKHAYIVTKDGSIMIFERVGNAEGQQSTTPVMTTDTGALSLPLTQYRDASGMLCFAIELQGTPDSDNWLNSRNWTLADANEVQCGTAMEDIPYVEDGTNVLRIPYGKTINQGEVSCFSADLQVGDDSRNWTLLAGNYRTCQ